MCHSPSYHHLSRMMRLTAGLVLLSSSMVSQVFADNTTSTKGVTSMDSLSDVPDIPLGPYKTGFQSIINVNLAGGPVNIAVWYPVAANTVGTALAQYTTRSSFPMPSDPYDIRTLVPVYENASVLPGKFPTIYYFHGDLKNHDAIRFMTAQTGEKLATHGIIYVTIDRQNSRDIAEAQGFIDYMQNNSVLSNSIDQARIGVAGQSAGGINGSEIASTNPNVKGFESDDGYSPFIPNVPIIRFGSNYIGLVGQDKDLLNKSNGRPLIFLTSPRFRHLGFYDNLCESNRNLRELAIAQENDPTYEPLIDPRTNPNGIDAYGFWVIPQYGITGNNYACNTADWVPAVPSDAFAASYGRRIRSDIQTKFAVLYRVAFWRKVFFNDTSMSYLFDPTWINSQYDNNVLHAEIKP